MCARPAAPAAHPGLPGCRSTYAAQAALQEVYGDDVELCDVLVGNLAEDKIDGFAIR